MKSYENFFASICRVCLSYDNSENMVSLTDNSTKDGLSCYGEAVFIFTNIRIKNDSLPNKMCEKCLLVLKQAIIFRKTCESSNEKLTKYMRKFDAKHTDFKEKLCEYVLFMNSYPKECLFETSGKGSLRKNCMETKATIKKVSKNAFRSERDNDAGDFMDFEDLFPQEIEEKANLLPKLEDDIENLLNNMETVAGLRSHELKMYQKRYPKVKKHFHSKPLLKIQKEDRLLFHRRERRKRKREQYSTEEDLQCKVCMKVMATSNSMLAHMERHTGGQFVCEQCGRKYCTLAELKYHLASSHDIGAQFVCKVCGFKAPKKYELMEHERIHTGERPYACDKCGLTFRRRYIWKKHALYHMEKTIQCQQCPRKFYVKGELIAHVNGVHERMYVYACSHCDATYAKTGTVRRHMAEKHGIAREIQGKIRRINLGKTSNIWNSGKGRPSIQTM